MRHTVCGLGMDTQACAAPEQLVDTLRSSDLNALRAYERGSPAGIVEAIDRLMGLCQQPVKDQEVARQPPRRKRA